MSSTPSLNQSAVADITVELATTLTIHNTTSYNHSNLSTFSDSSSSSSSLISMDESKTVSFMDLITSISSVNEYIVFYTNGYEKVSTIRSTLQGALYKAIKIDEPCNGKEKYVAIKRTDKQLCKNKIAIEDDIHFLVTENIINEASILKYLTVNNTPIGNYIVKYIDFFETEDDYYLVMEYVASETNVRQFISKAQQHIKNGKLSMKDYKKAVKFLMWQLCVTVQWLHMAMKCCHLDLCLDNIMLENATFIEKQDVVKISPNICIKLCDFGVSEVFGDDFSCTKCPLSIDNEAYSAPKVFLEEAYDARCADNWSIGMILFECMNMGQRLYEPLDIYEPHSGLTMLQNHQLKIYLKAHDALNHFNVHSFAVLEALLDVDETQRLRGMDILQHPWFNMYYKRYQKQLTKKFTTIAVYQ